MAAKKKEAQETSARVCHWCNTETFAYQEVKTKRGTSVIVCNACLRGACKNGQAK